MKKISLLACLLMVIPLVAQASNLVDDEKEIYVARPLITEPAWTQTGVYLKSFMFDLPNAVSMPSPQVGFVFTPGFTWSVFDILELNVGFPLILNPDETGDREKADSQYKLRDNFDEYPDFDLPGLILGLKGNLLGKKATDEVFLAVGVTATLPIIEKWATNFHIWKTGPNHSSPFMVSPYLSVGYTMGRFSPQLQAGVNFRFDQMTDVNGVYITDDEGNTKTNQYTDVFFNLALPFAFPFEGTVPMLEINGIYNFDDETAQMFITPAVTFLPKGSPAWLGFACMIPILDSDWRKNEGFRFMVNFSYKFDALAIPALGGDEESGGATDESPPAGW
jgi:hypothetical protein